MLPHFAIVIENVPRPWPAGAWRRELAEAVRTLDELRDEVGLGRDGAAADAARGFEVRVPRSFVRRIHRGDPDDPLLRQVLPVPSELDRVEGFSPDPLREGVFLTDGMLAKYAGRTLVMPVGACAVHCRYCFRRHFPYEEAVADERRLETAMQAVARDPGTREVILSGGDPLMVTDAALSRLVGRVEAIPHVRRLRLHTRLPVVLPSRVDENLVAWLGATRLDAVVVLHVNHPNEIVDDVRRSAAILRATGATLLNQSVLLAGVNDDAAVLADLSEELIAAGVLPYYLHLLDRVAGAAHFDVTEDRARRIHRDLLESLPGYLVPRLVREVPGASSKTWIR